MAKKSNKNNGKKKAGNIPPPRGGGVTQSSYVPRSDYVSRNVAGVQQSTRQTLVLTVNSSLTATVSTYTEQAVFLMNTGFRPYLGLGAAATGFDKWMTFYSKCFVMGARVKIQAVCATQPCILGLCVTTNASALANLTQAMDAGLCQHVVCFTNPDHHSFNESIDVGKFLHKSKVLDDAQLFCTATADPSQVICAHFFAYGLGASNTTGYWTGQITVDCVFTDPIPFT